MQQFSANIQRSARLGLNPFQPYLFNLRNTDYSQGQNFPQIEGDSIYVEIADYPVIASLIDAATNEQRAYVLQPGLQIVAPFKGLTLIAPAFGGGLNTTILKLVVGKDGAVKSNESAAPFAAYLAAFRVTATSAIQQLGEIHIPKGVRALLGFQMWGPGTTITGASLSFSAVTAAGLVGMSGSTIVADSFNYNLATQAGYMLNTRIAGTRYVAEFAQPMVVPFGAVSLAYQIDGTGLAQPQAILPNFV